MRKWCGLAHVLLLPPNWYHSDFYGKSGFITLSYINDFRLAALYTRPSLLIIRWRKLWLAQLLHNKAAVG